MKKVILVCLGVAILYVMLAGANVTACDKNGQGKWAMHYAGAHDPELNNCDYAVTDCSWSAGQIVETGPMGPGHFDVYVLALDTDGIAGTRYGICSDPASMFYFYGWTSCCDMEICSSGWPGNNEGIAQVWITERAPGHVTLGILDVYVYPGMAHLKTCADPLAGFAEWCDSDPCDPECCKREYSAYPQAFGYVGFGCPGYNPCEFVAVEQTSWGAVKAIYR